MLPEGDRRCTDKEVEAQHKAKGMLELIWKNWRVWWWSRDPWCRSYRYRGCVQPVAKRVDVYQASV
jgi:hypothetical protein